MDSGGFGGMKVEVWWSQNMPPIALQYTENRNHLDFLGAFPVYPSNIQVQMILIPYAEGHVSIYAPPFTSRHGEIEGGVTVDVCISCDKKGL